MKKNDVVLLIIGLILAVISIIYIIYKIFFGDIWSKNADKLNRKICSINKEEKHISDLSEYIPFDWDRLYVFNENVQIDRIYDVVGNKWENINKVTNEGMNQLVFVKDSKVVCYIYGYPKRKKVSYEFENLENNGEYTVFEKGNKLPFDISIGKDRIRYLKYVDETTQNESNEILNDNVLNKE